MGSIKRARESFGHRMRFGLQTILLHRPIIGQSTVGPHYLGWQRRLWRFLDAFTIVSHSLEPSISAC